MTLKTRDVKLNRRYWNPLGCPYPGGGGSNKGPECDVWARCKALNATNGKGRRDPCFMAGVKAGKKCCKSGGSKKKCSKKIRSALIKCRGTGPKFVPPLVPAIPSGPCMLQGARVVSNCFACAGAAVGIGALCISACGGSVANPIITPTCVACVVGAVGATGSACISCVTALVTGHRMGCW